jgi:hypothetical protein
MTTRHGDAETVHRSDTGVTAMPPPGLVSGGYDRFCRLGEEQIGSGLLFCVREVRVRWYEAVVRRWRVWNPGDLLMFHFERSTPGFVSAFNE